MKRFIPLLLLLGSGSAVRAVPVVPNFTQGSMTSHTETTSTVTETINSMDYATGWQYTVTGTGVETDAPLSPAGTSQHTITIDGVTSTWNGLDIDNRPQFTQTAAGASFQFSESYAGPGLQNQTVIQRTTTIESVTDTTSTFTQ
tara:strand:+ start:182 stop:613 length:432 start_codon:yes stop_codon:yes gene_type:complete